jgi:hypothetical protein
MKYLFRILILLLASLNTIAQITPSEGRKLNYRLVLFSVPEKKNNTSYKLSVAKGGYRKQEVFDKNIIKTIAANENKIAAELPDFDARYTWQIQYTDGTKTPLYHFVTVGSYLTDTSRSRLRIIDDKYTNNDTYFFLDYARSLYNMDGEKVWYMPDIYPYVDSFSRIRDLKATPFGTITFMTDSGAYEIDYNGKLLWTAPEVDHKKGLNYHHEFTRLKNGNYMLLSAEEQYRKLPGDSVVIKNNPDMEKRSDGYYKKILFSTIVEYSPDKKLAWSWKTSEYFTGDNFKLLEMQNSIYMASIKINGYYFDEDAKIIYAGFRDVSQILKIQYPSGNIITRYGKNTKTTTPGLFTAQHSYNINRDGDLLIYNNNVSRTDRNSISSIMILKEPSSQSDTIKKIWDFKCDIDDNAPPSSPREGNVSELHDGNILCCMGTSQRIFIVGKDKNVIFNSVSERWNSRKNAWDKFPQYRANILDPNNLKKFAY